MRMIRNNMEERMKRIAALLMLTLVAVLVACTPIADETVPVTSIVVASETVYLNVGLELRVEANVVPVDATNKTLEWTVSDTTVATVDQTGKLTGVAIGETTLTIKSVSTPGVTKVVDVEVVDQLWPLNQIRDFAGFDLPAFPDFTNVVVEVGENSLTLTIKGTSDDETALDAYKTTLLALDWQVDGTFDHHSGKLMHDDYEYYITMHNEFVHGGDSIEFKIIASGVEQPTTWDDINEEVNEHFGFELPVFPQFETLTINHGTNHELEIVISGITDVEVSLDAYLETLESLGWVAGEDNTHHLGTYTKEGLDVVFAYHESHSDAHTLEITLSEGDEHHHDEDEVLEWPSEEIDEHTGLTIPAYPQFASIRIHHESPFTLEILGIEDFNVSLFEYEDILNNAGWFADSDGLTDHIGYFFKPGQDYYIVLHNDLVHGGEALEIIFVLIATEGDSTTWPQDQLELVFPASDIPVYPSFTSLSFNTESSDGFYYVKLYGALAESIENYETLLLNEGWTDLTNNNGYINTEKTAIIILSNDLTTLKRITLTIQKIMAYPQDEVESIINESFVSFGVYDYAFINWSEDYEIYFSIYGSNQTSYDQYKIDIANAGWIKNDILDIYTKGDFNLHLYNYLLIDGTIGVIISNIPFYGDYFDTWSDTGLSDYAVEPPNNDGFEYFVYHGRYYGFTQSAAILLYGTDETYVDAYHNQLISLGYVLNDEGWYELDDSNYLLRAVVDEDILATTILISIK